VPSTKSWTSIEKRDGGRGEAVIGRLGDRKSRILGHQELGRQSNSEFGMQIAECALGSKEIGS